MKQIVKKNPLYFAFFFPMLMDGILTLAGQDANYWQNFKLANEASLAYFAMATHPALFILGTPLWLVFMYWLIKKVKHPYNLMLSSTLIAGHTWGSSTWISKIIRDSNLLDLTNRTDILTSWLAKIIYFVIIGVVAGYSLSLYTKKHEV